MEATIKHCAAAAQISDRQPAEGCSASGGWHAALDLGFERRGTRTILTRDRHHGPLLVQKALYPEGDSPCHAIVLHPPAGIVAGDQLLLAASVGPDAQALVTTPGATKWYRSASGATAVSRTCLSAMPGAILEYLPRESIVFDGAAATATLEMDLAADARLIGWDLWCLGRTASGERFGSGRLRLATCLRRDGRVCWEERGTIVGGSPLMNAAAGLAGEPVFGTLWAVGPDAASGLVAACRALPLDGAGRGAVTQLPQVLVARYLGPSTEEAFAWFTSLWTLLRPVYAGCEAVRPRIWSV
jgi:urease accessory protein